VKDGAPERKKLKEIAVADVNVRDSRDHVADHGVAGREKDRPCPSC
jgi:hypothetical protein